jgi:hypothetical protein
MRPCTLGITFPSLDSASISGTESRRVIISVPAICDSDISGAKAKMFPAWMAPNVTLYKVDYV